MPGVDAQYARPMALPPPSLDPAAQPSPMRRSRRTTVIGVLLGLFSFLTVVSGLPDEPVNSGVLLSPIVIFSGLCSAFVVSMRRDRRDYEQAYAAFAAQQAVTQDRFEIARHLHDIISDGLALIHLRASVGRQLHESDPDQAVVALGDIEAASRSTIKELRTLLLVLRGESDSFHHRGEPTATPDFEHAAQDDREGATMDAQLNRFTQQIANARQANLHVNVIPDNAYEIFNALPERHQEVLLAGLREALANAARYAGPTQVTVTVRHAGGHAVLEVTDAGPVEGWKPIPGAGMGLAMIRESVTRLGGLITATSRPDQRGFSFAISLPIRPEAA